MKKCTFLKNTLWLIPIFCVKLKKLAENLWKDATRNDRQLCVSCLIVWGFTSHSRIFHSYGDVTIIGEMLQILTYMLGNYGSEGSSACFTYCDTIYPFIMVISEDPWHLHQFPSIWQYSYHYHVFTGYVCSGLDSNTQPFACESNPLTDCTTAAISTLRRRLTNVYFRCFEC